VLPGLAPFLHRPAFLVALAVGCGYSIWMTVRIKRIRLDDHCLYVSDYVVERTVPLRDIDYVTENGWIGGHPVTIHFVDRTAAGKTVVFMPKARYFTWSWTSHPVVDEITDAAERARAAEPSALLPNPRLPRPGTAVSRLADGGRID